MTVFCTVPKVALVNELSGLPKFGWLRMLYALAPNVKANPFSVMRKVFLMGIRVSNGMIASIVGQMYLRFLYIPGATLYTIAYDPPRVTSMPRRLESVRLSGYFVGSVIRGSHHSPEGSDGPVTGKTVMRSFAAL